MSLKVLVTGANGNIGSCLIRKLLLQTDMVIYAMAADKACFYGVFEETFASQYSERLHFISNSDFFKLDHADFKEFTAVHLAFSRRNRSCEKIAQSIDFTKAVFEQLQKKDVFRVAYVSSQGIYGNAKEIRTEQTKPAPESAYTMAKYSGEVLLKSFFENSPGKYTSIRLDSIIQSQNLVQTLCRQAKYDHLLKIKGGNQIFSYLDLEDAADALICLLLMKTGWKPCYNVGINHGRVSLLELADIVSTYSEYKSGIKPGIQIDPTPVELWAGMDSSLFTKDTGWNPRKGIDEMVQKIYDEV